MFITFYGINNIGKSTQAKFLVDALNKLGKKAIYIKFPAYDIEPTGPYINNVLRSAKAQSISEEELQMWFALNRFQFEPQLKQYLQEGNIVIAEDYVATSLAWGTAKGADTDWLKEINKHLLKEDLSIFIHGERTLSSVEQTHIHENNNQLIQRVEQELVLLSQEYNWETVQKQIDPQDTHKLILDIVKKKLIS